MLQASNRVTLNRNNCPYHTDSLALKVFQFNFVLMISYLTFRTKVLKPKCLDFNWRVSETSETLLDVVQWKTLYVYAYIYIDT